ncbi:MAG: MBL fold metallo-hydrolase [Spirochaetaceae bacterium]|nr:MBL fold metallo-hydrolase [Spirochaetaceae bacterium]
MKIYFHLSLEGFSNSYLIKNEEKKEAIIIDPGIITPEIINQIEADHFTLVGILVTHNHSSHTRGIKTLQKIYTPKIYAADGDVGGKDTIVIKGDGELELAGYEVEYISTPGHTPDSMIFKIGEILFTGDCLTAGLLGETNNSYARRTLISNIETKILSQKENLVIFPGHGPPSSVATEKMYNLSLGCPVLSCLN